MSRPSPGRLASIELVVIDVDGVLTDGRLWYGEAGEQLKAFHVRDGLGLRLLAGEGVQVAVVSARRSPPLERRLADLRIEHALLGRDDKAVAVGELAERLAVAPASIAVVGDDVLDLPAMRGVGLAIAVADAHPMVRAEAAWVTAAVGGAGAVREIADALLEARGGLAAAVERMLARAGDGTGRG